jgi:hypothetical protein
MEFVIGPLLPFWSLIVFAIFVGCCIYLWLKREIDHTNSILKMTRATLVDKDQIIKLKDKIIDQFAERLAEMRASLTSNREMNNIQLADELEKCRRAYSQLQDRRKDVTDESVKIMAGALLHIKNSFWNEGETYEDRVGYLQNYAGTVWDNIFENDREEIPDREAGMGY